MYPKIIIIPRLKHIVSNLKLLNIYVFQKHCCNINGFHIREQTASTCFQCQKSHHHQEHKCQGVTHGVPLTVELWKMKMDKIGCQRAAHHHDDAIPSDTSTITPRRSNYFPVSTHKFQYCSAHVSRLWKFFFGNRGDVEIVEARLKEWGRHGWRMGGKNEKERLVFMPGSQRACKSPRSVVEDSRRLIVIHHSWQPHRSERAWQHSPVWKKERGGKQDER